MSRSNTNDDPRFKKAVKKIIDNINVSVPDGMKCADYLPAEVQDMSLQQRIRRAVQRARGIKQPPPTMNIDTSTMSTVSTLTATPPSTKQKAKKVRHTSKAAHQLRKNKLLDREAKSNATKYATKLYAEYQKKEKKLSAEKVSAIVEKELGIRVPKRTIQNNFALGRIGTSPKKKGPKGHFDNDTVLNLTNSFETYVKIKQLNGQSGDVTYKKLQKLLKQCTSQKKDVDCVWLMTRLLQESGVDLYHQLVKKMELHAAVDSMSKEERDELREKMKAADEMEVNDDEMPSVPILPNTESTPAAELFPDDMIDDEDTELIQESV